jgi:hypothetical protein
MDEQTKELTRLLSAACCVAGLIDSVQMDVADSRFSEDIHIIYTLHIIPLTRSKAKQSSTFKRVTSAAQGSVGIAEVHMHGLLLSRSRFKLRSCISAAK